MTSKNPTANVPQTPTDDKGLTRSFSVRMAHTDLRLVRRAAFLTEESRSAFIARAAAERALAVLRERGERAEDVAA